jgi:hypothetical protein
MGKRSLWTVTTLGAAALVLGLWVVTPSIAQTVRAALIRDVDNPALQPVEIAITVIVPPGGSTASLNGSPVPAGKRLVIETVSVFGYSTDPERITAIWLTKNTISSYVSLDPQTTEGKLFGPSFPGLFLVAYNRNVRYYLNPGEAPRIEVWVGGPSGQKFANVFLHGYYVTL